MARYRLAGFADEILVERVAIYQIRIGGRRFMKLTWRSRLLLLRSKYTANLHSVFRTLIRELALTRAARKSVEKNDVLADVDLLLSGVVEKTAVSPRMFRRASLSCVFGQR